MGEDRAPCRRLLAGDRVDQEAGGGLALLLERLGDRRKRRVAERGGGGVVEADHAQRCPALARRLLGADRDRVAHREYRCRFGIDRLEGLGTAGFAAVREGRVDGRVGIDVAIAGEPLAREIERTVAVAVGRVDEREDRHALVAELLEMARAVAGGGAIVDADERGGEVARLVDRDHREAAGEGGLDARVVGRHRVGEEAVDRRLADDPRRVLVGRRSADDQQAGLRRLDARGDAAQEERRRGVAEGEREAGGEEEAERAAAAGAQPPGRRIRARVAELAGGFEDPLARVVGHAVGAVEGVGSRSERYAGRLRDIFEGDV